MLSTDDVALGVRHSSQQIATDLASHPLAGEKFMTLPAGGKEAWIAWTWLYRELVDRGHPPRVALAIRSTFMERAKETGTYEAIRACLNAHGPDTSEDPDDELDLLDEFGGMLS